MSNVYLNPESVGVLTQIILALIISIYLLSIKEKSSSTWLLTGFFVGATGYTLSLFLDFSLYTSWQLNSIHPTIIAAHLMLMFLLQFVYHFPYFIPSQRLESRIVIVVSAFFLLYGLGVYLFSAYHLIINNFDVEIGQEVIRLQISIALEFIWSIIVLIRKTILLSTNSGASFWRKLFNPLERDTKATRAFAIAITIPVLLSVANILRRTIRLSPIVIDIVNSIGVILFLFIIALVYLNHSSKPTSFMVKLVGVSLITILTILGVVGYFTAPFFQSTYLNTINDHQTIHFEPIDQGGYEVSSIPFHYDENYGVALELGEKDTMLVQLGFSFPFYDREWREVYVDADGFVGFGEISDSNLLMLNRQAGIAPFLLDLDPPKGGGVFHKNETDRTVITWDEVPTYGKTITNTFQLTLYQDGSIDFTFNGINPDHTYTSGRFRQTSLQLIGIQPGNRSSSAEVEFSTDPNIIGKPNIGIIENFEFNHFYYMHIRMMPFAWIIIISTLIIVFGFPIFFRDNLVIPLNNLIEGVKRVNSGDMTVSAEILFNDEIGFLTNSFNRMVNSIQKADKLKDDFLANTSHELRTPLNGIIGLAESIMDGVAGKPTRAMKHNLGMIISSGKRLANMINDILDFSKLKNQDLILQENVFHIRSLTETILILSKPLLGSKLISLKNEIDPNLPLVKADENRVQQIMHNLIGNAIKFTEKGEISVYASQQFDPGPCLAITVEDTGIGIALDKLDHLFQPFSHMESSITREYEGTGLGLSITKKLVELHGGSIWAESKKGEGSRFTFTLPISYEEVTEYDPYDEISNVQLDEGISKYTFSDIRTIDTRPTKEKIKILIVDDEPINLQVLSNHLELESYAVHKVSTGQDAIELILQGKKYDLVILDVMMPKISGFEVCAQIREQYPPHQLPVIMLTAKNRVSDLIQGFGFGANDYLTKPFAKDELLTRIRSHLQLAHTNTSYGRFVPNEFLDFFEKDSIIEVNLGDHVSKNMAIMFSDIHSFTSLSETMTPQDNFDFVNSYFQWVSPSIRNNKGFIIKYLGDGMMAAFPGGVEDALRAGNDKLKMVAEYNKTRIKKGYRAINVGVGLHTGYTMVGIVGEENRMQGDAFSDNVNLSSRLEELTRVYGVSLIVSEEFLRDLREENLHHIRFLDITKVKGRHSPVKVYEIYDSDPPEIIQLKEQTQKDYNQGTQQFFQRNFDTTIKCMERVLTKFPADKTSRLYLERAKHNEKKWNSG